MATKIRLARGGAKKRPFYRIVVADERSPRDGRFIERLGTYNPMLPKDSAERVQFNAERMDHWLKVGAQPTERVIRFLRAAGVLKDKPVYRDEEKGPKQAQKLRKHQPKEEPAAEAPAEEAPAEEAAAEAPAEEVAAEAPAEEAAAEEKKEA